jgi:hypothetical protein
MKEIHKVILVAAAVFLFSFVYDIWQSQNIASGHRNFIELQELRAKTQQIVVNELLERQKMRDSVVVEMMKLINEEDLNIKKLENERIKIISGTKPYYYYSSLSDDSAKAVLSRNLNRLWKADKAFRTNIYNQDSLR